LAISLLVISSCGKGELKVECSENADCSPKLCSSPKCVNQKCMYDIKTNCCGNKLKEVNENGKSGSPCTCPQDYGKCEGKAKVKVGSRMEDAVYVRNYCDEEDLCVLGVDKKDIAPQNFLDSISPGIFKATSVIKYNKPFNMDSDEFEIRIVLDDASKDLIFPVTLTKVRVLFSSASSRGEQLIAEKDIDKVEFGEIGEEKTINVPLNLDYRINEAEETGSIKYSIDYNYQKQIKVGKEEDGKGLTRLLSRFSL